MLLSKWNIQDLVTEQINDYLFHNVLTFEELKTYITSKAPIPAVQTQCIKILTDSKNNNLIKVQKDLETQAYKKQIAEDEKQEKLDGVEEKKDKESETRLTREFQHIPTLIQSHETECYRLRGKIARLRASAEQSEAIHHHKSETKEAKTLPKNSSALNEQALKIERLDKSLHNYVTKIQTLTTKHKITHQKILEIKERAKQRRERQTQQSYRLQARTGYQSSGEGVLLTLSESNQTQLIESIRNQVQALEKKCSDLIQDAQAINFGFFLGLLSTQLDSLKLTAQENEAIKTILNLMKKHLEYEQQSAILHDRLMKKEYLISSQNKKLDGLNSKLQGLQTDNPSLTDNNQQLDSQNKELNRTLERNSNLRKRLGTPSLLFLTLTFVFSVPLILTYYGVIPFFISPMALYALVVVPPALLLLATLTVGIAALVYGIKAHYNESSIQMNLQTIHTNLNQVRRNTSSLHTLQTNSIPNLTSQIKKDELAKNNLIASLQDSRVLAEQSLQKAKTINPISYASSTVLSSPSAQGSEKEDDDDQVHEEQEDLSCLV